MLAGEAVVAIWNGIAEPSRAAYYEWHTHEHMPERVGIPGVRRGRRYIAADAATRPEFFTLYEADTMQVLRGMDYANRLNAPTPGTRAVTAQFRDTARALSRVLMSAGPGSGGFILTIRFDAPDDAEPGLMRALRRAAADDRVVGVHLCQGDAEASDVRTTETEGRTDIQTPPTWFAMIEATDGDALAGVLTAAELHAAGAHGDIERGVYRLEYTRLKTASAPG